MSDSPDSDRPEPPPPEPTEPAFRSGYVALVGEPNVGKSTLLNQLLQQRLAIVTAKPQTTRRKTLGILTGERYQMVLLDTPGLLTPRYELQAALLREAKDALSEADIVLYIVEPKAIKAVPEVVQAVNRPRVLAINKIDTLKRKEDLLPLLVAHEASGLFQELVPISALGGDGVADLVKTLVSFLPEGEPFYPPDQIAAQPERFFVAEIIRERIFELFWQEVPYASEVTVEEFTERPEARDYIEAWIHVEEESQKAILIGKKGQMIKRLGEEAREAIESFTGRPAYLSLRVRVLPRWRKKPEALRKLGYRS